MSTDVLWPVATEAAFPCAAQTAELEEEAAVADDVHMGEIDTGASEQAVADEIEQDEMMQGQIMPKLVNDTTPVKDNIKWKPVIVCDEIIGIKGGFLPPKKAMSAKSILIMTKSKDAKGKAHQTPLRFVELDKNAEWFLKAAGGPKVHKGDLKAVCHR